MFFIGIKKMYARINTYLKLKGKHGEETLPKNVGPFSVRKKKNHLFDIPTYKNTEWTSKYTHYKQQNYLSNFRIQFKTCQALQRSVGEENFPPNAV